MKVKVAGTTEVDLFKVNFLGRELEEAYSDYTKRRNEVISKLYTMWRDSDLPDTYKSWLKQAARFIMESDMR